MSNAALDKNDAEAQAIVAQLAGKEPDIKQGAQQTLGNVVPILRIDIRPTNVDPKASGGVQNMKRVLSAILNDEGNKITVKDEAGRAVGVRNFSEVYPRIFGPQDDGSIQVEYHEQATLGWLGDVMWSLGWFTKRGVLGVPRQMVSAVMQQLGVSFVLETYYQSWLATILDQFNQRGLLPGYVNSETGVCAWEVKTETIGRNIVVRPVGEFVLAKREGDQKRG
jgi:hypothetical protein